MTADQIIEQIKVELAEMDDQIAHCRKHGDNWEADFLEGHADGFRDIVTRYQQEQDAADRG